jgi:hypothetical protein
MTVINLIPPVVLLQRASRKQMRLWAGRLIACGFVLAVAYAGIVRIAAGPSSEVRRLSERVEQLQVRFRGAESVIGERDRLATRLAAIASISNAPRAGWYLEQVGTALTPESYLNYVGFEHCLVADEKSGRGKKDECQSSLVLRGYAPGHGDVGEVLRALKVSGAFSDVTLAAVTELPGESPRRDVRFHLECRLAER